MILISNFSLAETLSGYFKTETSETGGYLIVEMGLCENNKKLTCGKIVEAEWDDNGSKITDYEHLNKLIVWDMKIQDKENIKRVKSGTLRKIKYIVLRWS